MAARRSGARTTEKRMAKDGKLTTLTARAFIDAACQQVVAGKLAARQLADWIANRGVTEAEFRLLWLLFGSPSKQSHAELEQSELVERLAASPAHVSGAVERLRLVGLIEVGSSANDRRRQQWRLTAAGVDLVGAVITAVEDQPPASAAAKNSPRRNAA